MLHRKRDSVGHRAVMEACHRYHFCLICLLIGASLTVPSRLCAQAPGAPTDQAIPPEAADPCRLDPMCGGKDVEGYVLYDAEEYSKALAAWEQAYSLVPTPRLWLSQGRCLFRLGNCQRAEALYRRYLQEVPGGEYQETAERWMADLHALPQCAPPPPPPPRTTPWWPFAIGGAAVLGLSIGLVLKFIQLPHVPFH